MTLNPAQLVASEEDLLARLDRTRIPQHVAVIMDGNRRWAHERRLPVLLGHRAGVKTFRRVMEACLDLGVKVLTAYAFSVENWRRSPAEVRVLMQLFEHYTRSERDKMLRNGIRFRPLGRLDLLPEGVQRELRATAEATRDNRIMTLNLAINYGGRDELVEAFRRVARQAAAGELDPENLTEETVPDYLWTAGQPDPDLLIRTSGEQRVSNFLLWQIAYTEFYFTPLYWPDITRRVLLEAFLEYQARDRRFGGSTER
ncbi:MAG: isoprenyl transferase [Candidatus Eremiobacterota bacterium]